MELAIQLQKGTPDQLQALSSGPMHQTNSTTTQIIGFTTSESTRLLNPYHDALVISLVINNCLTKRVLIDNGSSTNTIKMKDST